MALVQTRNRTAKLRYALPAHSISISPSWAALGGANPLLRSPLAFTHTHICSARAITRLGVLEDRVEVRGRYVCTYTCVFPVSIKSSS